MHALSKTTMMMMRELPKINNNGNLSFKFNSNYNYNPLYYIGSLKLAGLT